MAAQAAALPPPMTSTSASMWRGAWPDPCAGCEPVDKLVAGLLISLGCLRVGSFTGAEPEELRPEWIFRSRSPTVPRAAPMLRGKQGWAATRTCAGGLLPTRHEQRQRGQRQAGQADPVQGRP